MPVCPECKYEYVEGVKKCSDCGAALIESIETDDDEPLEEIKWKKLRTDIGVIYTEMLKEVLENEDIPCILKPADLSPFVGKGTNVLGDNTHLLVPEERYEEALKIMQDMSE